MAICALCLKDRILVKSHIFPEFLYKPMYDDKHRFLLLSTDPTQKTQIRHKGIYEELLCKDCDGKIIGTYEDYAAKVLFEDRSAKVQIEKMKRGLLIHNLDYTRFKLFQVSLLWRSSISNRFEIPRIDLGPHGEKMRKMLLNGNPGEEYEYGVSIFYFPKHTKELIGFIYPPEKVPQKMEGHTWYRAVFNGLFWTFIVSSHAYTFKYKDFFLSKNGTLTIVESGPKGEEFLQHLASDLTKSRKLS